MGLNYSDDDLDGGWHQMTIEDYFEEEVKPNLFAVSRVFAAARKQMTLAEYKALSLALSRISWKEECPDTLYLDKRELAKAVGVNSDPDHLSVDLNRAIGEMPAHSFIKFADKDKDMYLNGNFVRTVALFRNKVRIRLEGEFLPLFGNLGKDYITMWSQDIFRMRTERSVQFYELLRENTDTRLAENVGTVSIKKFKELFDIPKDGKGSYVLNGHFQRTHFEKRVIDPICEDLAVSRMIQLIVGQDGKYYEKVKRGNRVVAYKFHWAYTSHPSVLNAVSVTELQERVDKDPLLLKTAKDVAFGKKRKRKPKPPIQFNQFPQREYDYEELERELTLNIEGDGHVDGQTHLAPDGSVRD